MRSLFGLRTDWACSGTVRIRLPEKEPPIVLVMPDCPLIPSAPAFPRTGWPLTGRHCIRWNFSRAVSCLPGRPGESGSIRSPQSSCIERRNGLIQAPPHINIIRTRKLAMCSPNRRKNRTQCRSLAILLMYAPDQIQWSGAGNHSQGILMRLLHGYVLTLVGNLALAGVAVKQKMCCLIAFLYANVAIRLALDRETR